MVESIMKPNQLFHKMLESCHKQGKGDPALLGYYLVGIDPGETTGISWRDPADNGEFVLHVDQIRTPDIFEGTDALEAWLTQLTGWPTIVTVEDYKVYSWKADQHKFAGLHTPQLIGALKRMIHKKPNYYWDTRMAQGAKTFATDDLLKQWNLYDPGQKHGRDASRHLLTTAFFGKAPNTKHK